MNAIPIVIYQNANTASQDLVRDAWGAAFVLMVAVLILSIVGRMFAARLTRKSR
jgi:ABC-type phosphate transport system permease subunit